MRYYKVKVRYLGTVRTVAKRYNIDIPKFVPKKVLNIRVYTKDILFPYYYMGAYDTVNKTITIDYRIAKFVRDFRHVFLHEVAHAMDCLDKKRKGNWHGPKWRKIARKLKVVPVRSQGDVTSKKLYNICMKVYDRREKTFFPKGYR